MEKQKVQEIAFGIISTVAQAKHIAMTAFTEFKNDKNKDELSTKLAEAEKILGEVGKMHMDVLQAEATGAELSFSPIFMHAEDQFMTVQMMIEMLKLIHI